MPDIEPSAPQKLIPRRLAAAFRQDPRWMLLLLFLIFITLWLRLVNLGYSDFQGDEIRALWLPAPGQGAMDFLYSQGRGPVQYLMVYLVKLVDPTYANQLLARLPFTLAGILAVYFFYRLARMQFGSQVALYASLFMACNGLFVGLMRIVQYQPFVMLFSILALYCFARAGQDERWKVKGIYAGFLAGAAGIFAHYDGVFIAPFAIYLLYQWYQHWEDLPKATRWRTLVVPAALSALLLAAYFVPYLIRLPIGIQDYWAERFTGEEQTGLLPSSIYTFQLYNPLLGLPLYAVLGTLSLIHFKKALPVVAWMALPWAFMEFFIYQPGTHIYAYVLPLALLAGIGVAALEDLVSWLTGMPWEDWLNAVWIPMLFVSLAAISHLIFVDHTPEYPLEQRRVLFWTIGGRDGIHQQWNYGFPYYRGWEEIRDFLVSHENNGYFASNEKYKITSFYLPFINDLDQAGTYLYIHYPQSFRIRDTRAKVRYWRERYPPDKIFESEGRVVAEVYYLAPGTLQEIKKAGY